MLWNVCQCVRVMQSFDNVVVNLVWMQYLAELFVLKKNDNPGFLKLALQSDKFVFQGLDGYFSGGVGRNQWLKSCKPRSMLTFQNA